MSNIFDIGSSALNSLQRAISTTGNNIANANTDGYSRQEVEFASRTPNRIGGCHLWNGCRGQLRIRRAYDAVPNPRRQGADQFFFLLRALRNDGWSN